MGTKKIIKMVLSNIPELKFYIRQLCLKKCAPKDDEKLGNCIQKDKVKSVSIKQCFKKKSSGYWYYFFQYLI